MAIRRWASPGLLPRTAAPRRAVPRSAAPRALPPMQKRPSAWTPAQPIPVPKPIQTPAPRRPVAGRNQLSQAQRVLRDRSTRGSPPMSVPEICRGYRRLG